MYCMPFKRLIALFRFQWTYLAAPDCTFRSISVFRLRSNLYLIYVNGIYLFVDTSTPTQLFADDCVTYTAVNDMKIK